MPNLAKQLTLLKSAPITLDVAAGKELPTRLRLMKWGANPGAKGTFYVNSTTLRQLPGNQKATNFDTVAFDFEHNSVRTSETYKGEPVKVAGHGVPEVVENDGLYLNHIVWTPEGKEHVGGGHYKDLSPSILTNAAGEVTFLHSVAACRQGALHDAPITLSASDFPALAPNDNPSLMKPELLKLLAAAGITVPANATDADILKLVEQAEGKLKTLSATPPAKPEEKKSTEPVLAGDITATLTTLNATLASQGKLIETLSADLNAIKGKTQADEIALILNSAASEGKVVPKEFLEGDTKVTPAVLRLLVANIAPTIPLDRRTPLTTPGNPQGLINNSADEAVRKQLGITKEEWDKLPSRAA